MEVSLTGRYLALVPMLVSGAIAIWKVAVNNREQASRARKGRHVATRGFWDHAEIQAAATACMRTDWKRFLIL